MKVQKANDIHLTSHLELEFEQNGNIHHVYLFSFIAVLILLIAIINFMNLATARAANRGKEVGLRKALGAHRTMLMGQFVGEAMMTSILSLVLAIGMISLALPWFNEITGKTVDMGIFSNHAMVGALLILALVVGLLAGS